MESNDYFRTYRLLIEYKQLLQAPLACVYLLPSGRASPTRALEGTISVRTGLYQRAVLPFVITVPELYPAHEPIVTLLTPVPHPLISPQGRVSASHTPTLRACLEHLVHILHTTDLSALCRDCLAPIVDTAAYDLWQHNRLKFKEQVALAIHAAAEHLEQPDLTLFHQPREAVTADTIAQFRRDLLAL